MDTPQRRNTKFPGNSVSSLGKRPADTDVDSSRLSASKIPKIPKFLESRQRINPPAVLPIKPNHRSQQFSPTSRFNNGKKQTFSPQNFVNNCNPWQGHEYLAILKEKQDGGAIIAHKQEISHPLVAVKQLGCSNRTGVKNLVRCSHENIVHLYDVYVHSNSLYFMYECSDVSLSDIQATPYGDFATYQIAAICQEVVNRAANSYSSLTRLRF